MSDSMPRDMFERILRNPNLWDNKELGKEAKFSEVFTVINELNKRFLKFSFNGENISMNESMIPYYRTHDSRQRINKKLIQVGYNIWVLAEAYGSVVSSNQIKV